MTLDEILSKINIKYAIKSQNFNLREVIVANVELDSRNITPKIGGDIAFFDLKGENYNADHFIDNAIENGAKIIISCDFTDNDSVISIKTENIIDFLTEFLNIFYCKLPQNLFAITGTNGKSSVVEFGRQIMDILGKKSASIGTIGVKSKHVSQNEFSKSSLTTPDIVNIYKNLSILKQKGIENVFIEASSIGIDQKRIQGLKFKASAFTNFSQDHLDYHKNMDDYFAAKMKLFNHFTSSEGLAIINSDIKEYEKIANICKKKNLKVFNYGFKAKNLTIEENFIRENTKYISFRFNNKLYEIKTKILPDFQSYNILCALSFILSQNNLSTKQIQDLTQKISNLETPEGRMQKIAEKNGATIYIDFAHSDDALKNILQNARKLMPKRLIVLFGCGGDRDSKKRPLMGKSACQYADLVIISDDNPRCEDPKQIRKDIIKGCDKEKTIEISSSRKSAIKYAIENLEQGDILILAGKGHEKYQIIGTKKIEFDESEIVKKFLRE